MRVILVALAVLVAWSGAALADEEGCDVHNFKDARLCTYEPNTLGYTWDGDDVGFIDFKVSVRYQLFPRLVTDTLDNFGDNLGHKYAMYMAFTGRFGQYVGSRASAPVIGKRYNPKIFLRRWIDQGHNDYFDIGIGHESNGQSINTAAQYAQARAVAERPDFANDQLSRGWDYLEVAWRKTVRKADEPGDPERPDKNEYLAVLLSYRYFLNHGIFQSRAEEYNGIEASPEGKPRSEVNGIAAMVKYFQPTRQHWGLRDFKAVLGYETGYHNVFRYSTWRMELGTKVNQLPVSFWYQTGYNSDLAQYYKNVSSRGLQVEIGSF